MEGRTTGVGIGSWCFPYKQAGAQHSQPPVLPRCAPVMEQVCAAGNSNASQFGPLAPIAPARGTGSGWRRALGGCGANNWRGLSRPRGVVWIRRKLCLSQPLAQLRYFEELRVEISFYPGEQFKPCVGER